MLTLHTPTPDEWEYRQKLYLDAESTAHNAPYGDNGVDGVYYISEEWLRGYLASLDSRDEYYAYVLLDGEPIGEVMATHRNDNLIGLILHAKYRGYGYGKEALQLLCEKVFRELGYEYITDEFGTERVSAEHAFKSVGFERVDSGNVLKLTRERYLSLSGK